MASKKYALVLALLGLLQTASFAQTQSDASDSYILDSSKVSVSHMPQYNEFKNNTYPYPAKPKSQIELGGGFGSAFILGDHSILAKNDLGHTYIGGITGNISLREALGHVFSLRESYLGSIVSIPHDKFRGFPSAKSFTHMLGVDAIASLNTISNYRGNPKTNIYALVGYDVVANYVQTWQGSGFHNYYPPTYGSITTFGGTANPGNPANGRKDWTLMHALSYGAGIAFKLSEKFNLAFEERVTQPLFAVGSNYLDGAVQASSFGGTVSPNFRDLWAYSTVRFNMNIGNLATHVAPLWWINPNNYVYNEINTPKHMKIPPPILPDADGDGVTDQFDLEPNTPAGAPVDTHGRSLDTDGDGVPDYRDKEKITLQSCFPVNADGVGTCPEPACCKELRDRLNAMPTTVANACALSSLPSVTFKAGSAKLSKDAMAILTGAAGQLQANPNCHVKVIGYAMASKQSQQLSWDRVNAVIKYLVEKQGISESRIIFSYGQSGDANTVDLQPTLETGPNTVPAPNPQYRTTK